MTSTRKLEEEIARTKDEQVRQQLQQLLDTRKSRSEKRKSQLENTASGVMEWLSGPAEPSKSTSGWEVFWVCLVILAIIGFFVFLAFSL